MIKGTRLTTPTLSDLRYLYYGGGSAAEYAYLQQAQAAGVTASSIVSGNYSGAGSPEGVVTAPVGSLYRNTTNGDVYSKTSGTGNTGWAKVGGSAKVGEAEITGAPGPNLDVTGIPGTYTHLQVMCRLHLNEVATNNDNVQLFLGAGAFDTGFNYRFGEFQTDQTFANGGAQATATNYLSLGYVPIPWGGEDADTWGRIDFTILDYANTTYWRTVSIEGWKHPTNAKWNRTGSIGHWQNKANPVQRIRVAAEAGHNFVVGSKIWVYGI